MRHGLLLTKWQLIRAAAAAFTISCCAFGTAQSFQRLDYYVASRQAAHSYPMGAVQHLSEAIFFIPLTPDANGNITTDTSSGSTFATEFAGMQSALTPGTKLTLGLGSLTAIVNSATAQQTFINNVQQVVTSYGFHGIDIDWEDYNNGGGTNNAPSYAAVVQAIASQFQPQGLTISVSFGASWEAAYLPLAQAVASTVNFFNLQFYYSTDNSMPLSAFEQKLTDYVNAGVAPSQIRVGLPTYAMVNPSVTKTTDKWRSWDQLLAANVDVTNLNQWTDPSNSQTYYFSGLTLLGQKISYAKSNGFAGVFTWELTQDTDYSNPLSANCNIDADTLGFSAAGCSSLVNGGFESGSLAGWSATNASITTTNPHSGTYAAALSAGGGTAATIQQVVNGLAPNTNYVLSGWVRTDGSDATSLGVNSYGGSEASVQTISSGWTFLAVPFTTGSTSTSATVFCSLPNGGSSACDDFNLAEVQQSLLDDGGFESGSLSPWSPRNASVTTTNPHSGTYAVALSAPSGSGAAISQVVTSLTANTSYVLSGWVRTNGTDTTSLGVKYYGGPQVGIQTTSTGWTFLAVPFTTGSANTSATVFCYLLPNGGASACDDYSLTVASQ